jgi:hypothetical protein
MEKYHPKNPENKSLVDGARKLQEKEAERAGFVEPAERDFGTNRITLKGDPEALEEDLKK